MKTYAFDFETYYCAGYGIQEMGIDGYLTDPRFDAYLMSVYGNGINWVGHPKDFDWNQLEHPYRMVAHNLAFDERVLQRCIETGVVPASATPDEAHCTANMCVFLGAPRNLKDASKILLGETVSKELRNYMKGKTWQDAIDDGKAELLAEYGRKDSELCWKLWEKYNDKWPLIERMTSTLTIEQTRRGIGVDVVKLGAELPGVLAARDEALLNIPWAGTVDEDGKELKALGAKGLRLWLKEKGIEAPRTTNAKEPDFIAWQEKHKDISVVRAMQTYRSANALALKGQTLQSQVRSDGRYPFSLLYFGATTGRWSGGFEDERSDSMGFNIQNLPKETMYGFNLRGCLVPAPGMKFVVSDYSQIEPRCLAWLCEDEEFLAEIRKGTPLYEAHARAQGSWTGLGVLKKMNPKLYAQKKAEVLALGYGAGWSKFIFMCQMYGAEECLIGAVTPEERRDFERYLVYVRMEEKIDELKTELDWERAINSWKIVTGFRRSKPLLTDKTSGLWHRLERDMRRNHGGTYTIELPSGRLLNYFNVNTLGGLRASKTMDGPQLKMYSGILTENLCQAVARDVMRDAMLNLEGAGIRTLFTVHDEIICEVPLDFDARKIREIMIRCPDWIEGLPLDVEQEETMFYKK